MFIYGLYHLLDDGLMTSTFDDIYVMMMLLYFLWCMLCDVLITLSYSHSLSKVFRCTFLVTMRNVEIPESCSAKDRAGRQAVGSITS